MRRIGLLAALAMGVPGRAEAHLVGVAFGDFYAGTLHLLSSPGDLALLAVVGLLVAAQTRVTGQAALLALPLGLTLGVLAVWAELPLPAAEPWVALCLGFGGLATALALRLPGSVTTAFTGAAGALIGASNAVAALDGGVNWALYGSGVVAAGTVLGTLAIAVLATLYAWRSWVPLAQRVLASWFAAAGAMVFGLSFAGI
ncbi:MAG: HupE/UreJ family protein [Pseudomonadota bacterium]